MGKKRGGAKGFFGKLFGRVPAAPAAAPAAPAAPAAAAVAAPYLPEDVGEVPEEEEGGYVEGMWDCPSCSMPNTTYDEYSPTLECEHCGYMLTPKEFGEVHRQQTEARAQRIIREQVAEEAKRAFRAQQISQARTQAERNRLERQFAEEDALGGRAQQALATHEAMMAASLGAPPPNVAAFLREYEEGGGRRHRRTTKKRRTKKYRK